MASRKLRGAARYRVIRQRDSPAYAVADLSVWREGIHPYSQETGALVVLRTMSYWHGRVGVYGDFTGTLESALRLLRNRKHLSLKTIRAIRARAHMDILGDCIDVSIA